MEKNTFKLTWHQALLGGLILGLALFAWDFVVYKAELSSFIATPVQIVLICTAIFVFGVRLRALRGREVGFGYGACFGFVLALMLCTGVIYGVGQYFLQVVIAPEHYARMQELALMNSGLDERMIEQVRTARESGVMKSPLVFLFSGLFSMILMGGFFGLILSAVLRSPADPFAGREPETEA